MSTIHFTATLVKINSWTILVLPKNISAQLPSRGMTIVNGTINDFSFQSALEPDGKGSHWFRVDNAMRQAIHVDIEDVVSVTIEPSRIWPEPLLPEDFKVAIKATPKAHALWGKITPMARWDWLRWIGATKQQETRMRRIKVACSKLQSGMRRPCCFNRTLCTQPSVSHNGILLEPTTL